MKDVRYYPKNPQQLEKYIKQQGSKTAREFFSNYHAELYWDNFAKCGVTLKELDEFVTNAEYNKVFKDVYNIYYESAKRDIIRDRHAINATIDDMVGVFGFTREEIVQLFQEDDDRTNCAIAGIPYNSNYCYIW